METDLDWYDALDRAIGAAPPAPPVDVLVRQGRRAAQRRRLGAVDESRRPWRRERPMEQLPDAPTEIAEDRSELFEALQRLPAMQRSTVVLRHWMGLSVEETAATLGISSGTVKSHTARGMAALRATLERTP
jgi:RNA polymerase sigma factor (sigma-70 family)